MPYKTKDLEIDKYCLYIEVLNEKKEYITSGTAFILCKEEKYYLCSSFHLIAGKDYKNWYLNFSEHEKESKRLFLKFKLDNINNKNRRCSKEPWKEHFLNLYDKNKNSLYKVKDHLIDNKSYLLDYFVIELNAEVIGKRNLEEKALIYSEKEQNIYSPIEKIYILGYPYGYSSIDILNNHSGLKREEKILPILMERVHLNTAMTKTLLSNTDKIYFENECYPSMSGSPVFVFYNESFHLKGVYCGNANPKDKNLSIGYYTILKENLIY